MKVKRGEVYLADLSDASGSEQGKVRPVVIIQNNRGNKYSPTTIVACLSSKIYTKHHLSMTRICSHMTIDLYFNPNPSGNK